MIRKNLLFFMVDVNDQIRTSFTTQYLKISLLICFVVGFTGAIQAGGPLNGTYTIGGTTPNYNTINDAVNSLMFDGVAGPVIFEIRDGVYDESFSISSFAGASASNKVLFRSESNDAANVTIQDKSTGFGSIWSLDTVSFVSFQHLTFRNDTTLYDEMINMTGSCRNVAFLNCHFESAAGDNDDALRLRPDTAWNITIENCSFDSLNSAVYLDVLFDSIYGVNFNNNTFNYTSNYALYIENGVDVEVNNNEITEYLGEPIYFDGCKDVVAKHNSVNLASYELLYFEYTDGIIADSNEIDSALEFGYYFYECSDIHVAENHTNYTYGNYMYFDNSTGIEVVNNSIDSTDGEGYFFTTCQDIAVVDNFIGYTYYSGVYIEYCDSTDILVEGNTVEGYVDDYGIYIEVIASNVTIRNNTFNGWIDEYGIYIEEAGEMIIEGNFIDSSFNYAIYTDDTYHGITISENEVNYAGDGGIYSGYAENLLIENNVLNNIDGYGIEIYRVDSSVIVRNNSILSTLAYDNLYGMDIAQLSPGSHPFQITGNSIHTIDESEGIVMSNVVCWPSNRGLIANNMISGVEYGFDISQCQNIDVLNNSVSQFGDATSAVYLWTDTGLVFNNNIFSFTSDDTSQVLLTLTSSEFDMNYNIYNIGSDNDIAANAATLADHQTTNLQDLNSFEANPMYYNDTFDLHVCNGVDIFQAGTAIAGPATDIDGLPRDLAAPSIGAQELEQGDGAPAASFMYAATGFEVLFDNTTLNLANYNWDFGDGNQSSDENPDHTYADTGVYIIELYAENDCGNSSYSDTVTIVDTTMVGIGGVAEQPYDLQLFPNPTTGIFTVNIVNVHSSLVEVEIFNGQGVRMWKDSFKNISEITQNIDLSAHASGLYFVNITDDEKTITYKLLKQ